MQNANFFGDGYIPSEYKTGMVLFENGDYDLIISHCEDKLSQNNNPMRVITFKVRGVEGAEISYYMVQNEYFNSNATKFFDTFGIQYGDFAIIHWVGKTGRSHVEQEEYTKQDGNTGKSMKVKYFIPKTSPQPAGAAPNVVRQQPAQSPAQYAQPKPAQQQYRQAQPTQAPFEDDLPVF